MATKFQRYRAKKRLERELLEQAAKQVPDLQAQLEQQQSLMDQLMQTPDQGGDIIQLAYAQRYIQEMREYQKHKEEVKRDRLRLAELEVEQALSQARIKSLEDLVLKLTFQVENLIMDVETARWINHHFADRTGVGFDEPAHKSLVNLASVHMTSRRGLKKIGVN